MKYTKANRKMNLKIVKAKGDLLFDDHGNNYIDFICGRGTANLGHCHPKIVDAICKQSKLLIHYTNEIRFPVQEEYVRRLGDILPEFNTVFLTNSGTESVEAAIKLARLYTHKEGIISLKDGFHGRSLGSLSATDGDKIKKPFYPLVPGFIVSEKSIDSISKCISDRTAAIIVEPIQGAGGINIFSTKFLKQLRDITINNHILLIFDECQSGFGRSGKYFAFQRMGVVPDILVTSKSICGGIPAGAIFSNDIDFPEGMHGGTFCGNPLVCAAGIAVLDVFKEEKILEGVAERENIVAEYAKYAKSNIFIKDFRYIGLMIGIEFDETLIDAKMLSEYCKNNGLLINIVKNKVIRVLPALNINEEHLKQGFEIIFNGIKYIAQRNKGDAL